MRTFVMAALSSLLVACNGQHASGGDSAGTTTEMSTSGSTGTETSGDSTETSGTDETDTGTDTDFIFDLGDPNPEGPFSTYAMTCNGGDVLATERLLIETQNGLQCPGSPSVLQVRLVRWPEDPGSVLDPGVQDLAQRDVLVGGEFVDATGTLEVEDLGDGNYVGSIDAVWDGGAYAGDFAGVDCGDDPSDCWGGN